MRLGAGCLGGVCVALPALGAWGGVWLHLLGSVARSVPWVGVPLPWVLRGLCGALPWVSGAWVGCAWVWGAPNACPTEGVAQLLEVWRCPMSADLSTERLG